jgi:hypothetical protein
MQYGELLTSGCVNGVGLPVAKLDPTVTKNTWAAGPRCPRNIRGAPHHLASLGLDENH